MAVAAAVFVWWATSDRNRAAMRKEGNKVMDAIMREREKGGREEWG